jgi:hypothetical protein
MSITLKIIQSADQVISGVPRFVSMEADVPCTIFYTLDGSDPTIYSMMYVSPINLSERSSVTVKAFASNGTETTDIITESFNKPIEDNTRKHHIGTANTVSQTVGQSLFGSGNVTKTIYSQSQNIQVVVDDPSKPEISNGYSASGEPNNFTNLPLTSINYLLRESTTDANGRPIVGTSPKVLRQPASPPPQSSNMYDDFFDPRALVIYHDVSKEKPEDPPHINRTHFDSYDTVNNPNTFYSVNLDSPNMTGSFIRSFYNPKTNQITSYFRDSATNKWIRSIAPYTPPESAGQLFVQVIGSGASKFVYQWVPGIRRALF